MSDKLSLISSLLDTEYDWPHFAQDELGSISYAAHKHTAREILDTNVDSPLLRELLAPRIMLLKTMRDRLIKEFKALEPQADISGLVQYWDDRYPMQEALREKLMEYGLDIPDDAQKEVDAISARIDALPSRKAAMLASIMAAPLNDEQNRGLLHAAAVLEIQMNEVASVGGTVERLSTGLERLTGYLKGGPEVLAEYELERLQKNLMLLEKGLSDLNRFAFSGDTIHYTESVAFDTRHFSQETMNMFTPVKEATQLAIGTLETILLNIHKIAGKDSPGTQR